MKLSYVNLLIQCSDETTFLVKIFLQLDYSGLVIMFSQDCFWFGMWVMWNVVTVEGKLNESVLIFKLMTVYSKQEQSWFVFGWVFKFFIAFYELRISTWTLFMKRTFSRCLFYAAAFFEAFFQQILENELNKVGCFLWIQCFPLRFLRLILVFFT